ncbi:DUF459 domain-containing protein [Candidatus Poriferisodalis sp.]|uniref:SGNH/GDSL hydrolase family protein n=1 Tax=Candidatus Poriferisodalis sp. TaxID=3101277 RepID=UPI003B024627
MPASHAPSEYQSGPSQDHPRLDATNRRTGVAAGRALAAGALGLVLAIALNAQQLLREAQQKPFGWERDSSVAIWEPVDSAVSAAGLHLPRLWVDEALGRTAADPGGTPAAPTGVNAEVTVPAAGSTDAHPSIVVAEADDDGEAPGVPSTNPVSETVPDAVGEPVPAVAPTPDNPLRLAVIGDSMVRFFGDTMVSLAHETGVIEAQTEHRLSSGLTRPDFYDWPTRIVEVMATDNPDAVVLMYGGNDAQGLVVDGQIARPFSDTWSGEYSARVGHVMDLVTTDPDRLLIWVGQPIMRDPDFDHKMVELNKIYAAEAAAREQVRYVDTRDLFRGPDGGFSRYVIDEAGQRTDVRLTDGVHLSTIGGQWLSQLLLDELGEMVDLG